MASKPMTDPKKLVGRLERVVLDRRPGFSLNADPQLLTEAAACIREMVEWRPIETAPRDGTEIILRRCERVCAASWIEWPESTSEEAGQGWTIGCDGDGWDGDKSPTHWLPLPPAPGAEA